MMPRFFIAALLSHMAAQSAGTCHDASCVVTSQEFNDDFSSLLQSNKKTYTQRLVEDIPIPDHTSRHFWMSEHRDFFLKQAERDVAKNSTNSADALLSRNHSKDADPLADLTTLLTGIPKMVYTEALRTANTNACKSYPNVIQLGPAVVSGLIDRFNQLVVMSELAQSLCARIVPAPPCASLMSFLAGDNFSTSITWNHYVDVTGPDGKSMFAPPDSKPEDRHTMLPAQFYGPSTTAGYVEAFDLQRANVPFTWPVLFDYGTIPVLSPSLKQRAVTAKDVKLNPSTDVWSGLTAIYNKLNLQDGKYVTIHIRRKDAIRVCDTSPSKVVSYVSCSLDRMGWLNQTSEPLIVLTDEEDPQYIDDVVKGLNAKLKGRQVIYGDGVIRSEMPSHMQDDPFIFLVGLVLRWKARGEMFMDRTFCETCADLRVQNQSFSQYALHMEDHITSKAAKESDPSTKDSAKLLYNFHPSCVEEALQLTYDLGMKPLLNKLSPKEVIKLAGIIGQSAPTKV